ncbi:sensor histidine kinase [Micromonospora endophytica]|uniref:sensor histidine kinase n=1 Tax=Micromonospora endophytica TaxID=515350 RepID=UPI0015E8AA97|nr:histidine kinase [Micromonospora endophytica]
MKDGTWSWSWLESTRARLSPYILTAVAFLSPFLSTTAGLRPYLQELAGLTGIPTSIQATVVGLSAAAAARFAPRRLWPLYLVATLDLFFRSSGLLVALASYLAATSYRRPRDLAIYAVAASGTMLIPTAATTLTSDGGGVVVLVWLPLMIGLLVAARRQVVAELRGRASQLQREQAARADQARAEERARIARDMHDVVAHHVSLMVLHAGALEISATDAATAAQAELIRNTGSEAMSQLRDVLGVLSSSPERDHRTYRVAAPVADPQPKLTDVDRLLDQARVAGLPVHRHDEGRPYVLHPMTEHAAYRIIQEALTNIRKHTHGSTARVTVRWLPTALEIQVDNTAGSLRRLTLPGSGLGLTGLRERVVLLGGEFSAQPAPTGGFSVWARMPS